MQRAGTRELLIRCSRQPPGQGLFQANQLFLERKFPPNADAEETAPVPAGAVKNAGQQQEFLHITSQPVSGLATTCAETFQGFAGTAGAAGAGAAGAAVPGDAAPGSGTSLICSTG